MAEKWSSDKGPAADSFTNPQKTGWLTKLGGKGMTSNWRRRWFVLEDNYLFYYKTKADKEPMGIVCLDNYDTCERASPNECKKSRSTLVISNSLVPESERNRKYVAFADNEEEFEEWVAALSTSFQNAQNGQFHGSGSHDSLDKLDSPEVEQKKDAKDSKEHKDDSRHAAAAAGIAASLGGGKPPLTKRASADALKDKEDATSAAKEGQSHKDKEVPSKESKPLPATPATAPVQLPALTPKPAPASSAESAEKLEKAPLKGDRDSSSSALGMAKSGSTDSLGHVTLTRPTVKGRRLPSRKAFRTFDEDDDDDEVRVYVCVSACGALILQLI
eukprot:Opistho-2@8788